MIPIYRMPVIHVEVTYDCNLQCSNCTRFVGHHKDPYYMDLDTVSRAIDSLEGYPGQIGIMGGEPTMHPQFPEICEMLRKKVADKRRRQLWTNGYKWKEYLPLIQETFDEDMILYNDHRDKEVGVHQPLLLAAEELLDDRELMWRLIGNCWVQWRWAASITPKGGFFCEVAAAQDHLFNGPGGYPLEKGWWNKNPNEFVDQVKRYCTRCSAAVPMRGVSSHANYDLVTPGNAKLLEAASSPRYMRGRFKVVNTKLTEKDVEEVVREGWTPWSHRPYKQCSPDMKWV